MDAQTSTMLSGGKLIGVELRGQMITNIENRTTAILSSIGAMRFMP